MAQQILVPPFTRYFPSKDRMDTNQLVFYKKVSSKLSKGEYIDVQGNISYVFLYLYDLLSNWQRDGFENLSDYLIYIAELYKKEQKLADYCRYWSNNCLLGLKKYEEFLEKTEPSEPYGQSTEHSNLRLNVQYHLGIEANPIDVLLLHGGKKSGFIINNESLYIDNIRDIFTSYAKEKGGWFKIFHVVDKSDKWRTGYTYTLFSIPCISDRPELEFNLRSFYFFGHTKKIKELSRLAENLARKEVGVHQIGEGWLSETMLFRKLESEFTMTTVIPHGQPKWLGKQHFDIWFPYWKIAVEYHGKQHFEPVDFFGGQESFEKTIERDKRKLDIAKKNNITLFVITEHDDQDALINKINKIAGERIITAPIAEIIQTVS